MNDKKTGGPAFPNTNEVTLGNMSTAGHAGMTLRDYFAAQAVGSMMDTSGVTVFGWAEDVAGGAYQLADAMLHARQSPVAVFNPDLVREKMGQALAAVLDEVGDGTGRTSPNSFLPQALVDRIEAVLGWGGVK